MISTDFNRNLTGFEPDFEWILAGLHRTWLNIAWPLLGGPHLLGVDFSAPNMSPPQNNLCASFPGKERTWISSEGFRVQKGDPKRAILGYKSLVHFCQSKHKVIFPRLCRDCPSLVTVRPCSASGDSSFRFLASVWGEGDGFKRKAQFRFRFRLLKKRVSRFPTVPVQVAFPAETVPTDLASGSGSGLAPSCWSVSIARLAMARKTLMNLRVGRRRPRGVTEH